MLGRSFGMVMGLAFAGTAMAGELFISLECRSRDDRKSTVVYEGFMLADEESLKHHEAGFSLMGREADTRVTQINDPDCSNYYRSYDWVWDTRTESWKAVEIQAHRDWNAWVVKRAERKTFLNCSADSVLHVYDNEEAWLEEIYHDKKSRDITTVSKPKCVVSRL